MTFCPDADKHLLARVTWYRKISGVSTEAQLSIWLHSVQQVAHFIGEREPLLSQKPKQMLAGLFRQRSKL